MSKTASIVGFLSLSGVVVARKYLNNNIETEDGENKYRSVLSESRSLFQKSFDQVTFLSKQALSKIDKQNDLNLSARDGVEPSSSSLDGTKDRFSSDDSSRNVFRITKGLAELLQNEQSNQKFSKSLENDLNVTFKAWYKILHHDEGRYSSNRPPGRFQDSLNDSFDGISSIEYYENRNIAANEELKRILYKFLVIAHKMTQKENPRFTFIRDVLALVAETITLAPERGSFYNFLLPIACGRFLCSVTLNKNHRSLLLQNQKLMQVLKDWSESKTLSCLSLIGQNCLWNLDNVDAQIPNGIFIWEPSSNDEKGSKDGKTLDVVWFHGLNGSAFYTWRHAGIKFDNFLTSWPIDWLLKDLPHNVRFIFMDYDTLTVEANLEIYQDGRCVKMENIVEARARELHEKMKVIQRNKGSANPVLLIGHSMGGLIIKQMLMLDEQEKHSSKNPVFHNLSGILFLSTPHFGSPIAKKLGKLPSAWVRGSKTLSQLGDYGTCSLLNFNFVKLMLTMPEVDVLSVAESLPTKFALGASFVVVPVVSAYPGFGKFRILKSDHVNVCKARDNNSDSLYQLVKDFVLLHVPSDVEELDFYKSINPNYMYSFVSLGLN
ncbi:protein SERAC1-like [Convolutriloba macropyga]|uniref:protein SERAC1-like n=1 Tax=Convolutriloba macropyga TaxID=536237 RepID=UPI003F51D53D